MTSKEALTILFMTCNEDLLLEHYNIIFPSYLTNIIKKDLDKLEQQTHQPTFDDCIKEWEERGFRVEIATRFIYIANLESNYSFIIDKIELKYHNNSCWMTIEINELLTKTLKALEEKDE